MNADVAETAFSADLLELEQRLIAEGIPFAVATVIRAAPPTSTRVGAQALIEDDGTMHGWIGGGCAQTIVVEAARRCMRLGQPKRVRISNEPCPADTDAEVEGHAMPCASNGTLELFIQPTVPAPLVVVFGATPTAHEACVLARRVGLRAAFATDRMCPGEPRYDVAALDRAGVSFALIATQGDGDEEALEAALRSRAAAVLLIASRRKSERLREAVRLRGVDEARFAALHAPAGPSIHAHTPQEIALGAVAGVIALRHEWEATQARALSKVPLATPMPHVAMQSVAPVSPCERLDTPTVDPARQINPVCGISVEMATAKHIVEYDGCKVYFCCDGCKVKFEQTPERYVAILNSSVDRAEGPPVKQS